MNRLPSLIVPLLATLIVPLHAAAPVVSNTRASQIAGTKNVEILYDVSDADGDALTIGVEISGDGGLTYTIPATALSGQVGPGVSSGVNRRIVWNAGADWNNQYVPNARARVIAHDGTTPVPPTGMVYIPAGTFQMGDNLDNDSNALPLHNVMTNAYFMDRFEVTKELWQSVQSWGSANGYGINPGGFKAPGHPVTLVSWYDTVLWCNARSEKEGLTPCYYEGSTHATVYRTGGRDLNNSEVNWSANGYRLPTEAEWEKAARGGALGQRFPWGNTISHSQANYNANVGDPGYDVSPTSGFHPTYTVGPSLYTSPIGAFGSNQYGLHDLAGNLVEWCWDWYDPNFFGNASSTNNPRGPSSGTHRVTRGGGWVFGAERNRNAYRSTRVSPGGGSYQTGNGSGSGSIPDWLGFRCVRGL